MLERMSAPAQLVYIFEQCGYSREEAFKKLEEIENKHGGVEKLGQYWCEYYTGFVWLSDEEISKIRNFVKSSGRSFNSIAKELDVYRSVLRLIVLGKRKRVSTDIYEKLKKILDMEVVMDSAKIFERIENLYAQFEKDAKEYIEKGCKVCAKRARAASVEMGHLLKDFRRATIEESKKK